MTRQIILLPPARRSRTTFAMRRDDSWEQLNNYDDDVGLTGIKKIKPPLIRTKSDAKTVIRSKSRDCLDKILISPWDGRNKISPISPASSITLNTFPKISDPPNDLINEEPPPTNNQQVRPSDLQNIVPKHIESTITTIEKHSLKMEQPIITTSAATPIQTDHITQDLFADEYISDADSDVTRSTQPSETVPKRSASPRITTRRKKTGRTNSIDDTNASTSTEDPSLRKIIKKITNQPPSDPDKNLSASINSVNSSSDTIKKTTSRVRLLTKVVREVSSIKHKQIQSKRPYLKPLNIENQTNPPQPKSINDDIKQLRDELSKLIKLEKVQNDVMDQPIIVVEKPSTPVITCVDEEEDNVLLGMEDNMNLGLDASVMEDLSLSQDEEVTNFRLYASSSDAEFNRIAELIKGEEKELKQLLDVLLAEKILNDDEVMKYHDMYGSRIIWRILVPRRKKKKKLRRIIGIYDSTRPL
ncbi:hypothetical protein AKO1_002121 [Acrasis kona]|uniref:Uncharacterized protein n=1 Tax=Acrasis kona TaxID=1008807 RepID=A0AAW2Z9F2_9EUKA